MRAPPLVLLSLLAGAAGCLGPSPVRTGAARAAARPGVEERERTSRPGPELDALAALVGEWEVEVAALAPGGAASEPQARGRARVAAVLGGRFLAFENEFEVAGRRVASRGMLGFDREREEYQLVWFSELASAAQVARGGGDARREGVLLVADDVEGVRTRLRVLDGERFQLVQDERGPDGVWRSVRRTLYTRAGGG